MGSIAAGVVESAEAGRDGAIELLRELVSFDTGVINQGERGNEGRAQPAVAARLRSLGCEVDVFEPDNERLARYGVHFNRGRNYEGRPNVVGVLKGKGGGRSLILSGHIDTVPYREAEWEVPPLGGIVRDGRVYGRGTADMKAGLAAMIRAVEAVKSAGVTLRGDVVIESVVDEEGGGNGTLACVDRGHVADGAVITEGTGEQVVVANRGVLNVEISVRGLAAHAARKWFGVNAIEKMVKVINGLGDLEKRWLATKTHPLLPSPTITVGQIEGGIGATIVPDACTIKCDVKLLPSDLDEAMSAAGVKRGFEDWIRLIASGDDWMRDNPPTVRWYSEVMPYEQAPDHPFVVAMRTVAGRVLGEARIAGMAGGSDARIMHNVGKVPTILFGPSGESAHSANEYVEIHSYLRTIKILALMVVEWCS